MMIIISRIVYVRLCLCLVSYLFARGCRPRRNRAGTPDPAPSGSPFAAPLLYYIMLYKFVLCYIMLYKFMLLYTIL